MSQRNKLRETLREHYDEQQFTIGPGAWDLASSQLKAARNKRILGYVLFLVPLLFTTVFIAVLKFERPNEKRHEFSSVAQQKTNTPAKIKSVLQHATPKIFAHTKEYKLTSQLKKHNLPVSVPEHVNNIQTDAPGSNIIPSPHSENPFEITKQLPSIGFATSTSKPAETIREHIKPKEHSETNFSEELPQQTETPPQEKEGINSPADFLSPVAAIVPLAVPEKETSTISVAENDIAENTASNYSISLGQNIIDTATTKSDAIVQDSSSISQPTRKPAGEGIFYEIGGAWFYGWSMDGKQEARGFSPAIGLNYLNKLGNRYDLSFGVQYIQVPNLSFSSKTSRVSSYTYGEQSKVTVITPTTLHYLAAPFRVRFSFSERQSFGMGINLAYLLNVDATVSTYDEQPGSTSNYETEKLSGYMRGFSWYDSQLAAFYRRRIISSLDINAEVFFGLKDIKQNEFFGASGFQRNSGFKLTLIYYAFRNNVRK